MKKGLVENKSTNILDVDTFNALSLISPELAEYYKKDNGFISTIQLEKHFAETLLKNAKNKNKVLQPDFLKHGNKSASESFKTAIISTDKAITNLQQKLKSGEFSSVKEENCEDSIKEILFILKARKKMLELAIIELKNKKNDAFQFFQEIESSCGKVSEILKESYEKELENEIIIQNLIQLAKANETAKHFVKPKVYAKEETIEIKNSQNFEKAPEKIKPNFEKTPERIRNLSAFKQTKREEEQEQSF